jgi:outer membrane protein OmpA-like peptidoglycan-associated protein
MSMYGYDDEEGGGRSTGRIALALAVVAAVGLIGWFVVLPRVNDDDGNTVTPLDAAATSVAAGPTTTESGDAPPTTASEPAGSAAGTVAPTTDAGPPPTATSTTTTTTTAPVAVAPTTAAPTTTAARATTTTVRQRSRPRNRAAPSYPTLPDGSPVPVVAIFDVETITLSGTVPSRKAKRRLETLAIANSKFPDASVVSFLAINPDVPLNVGVRVVELTSARFPPASDEIRPEHALEFDRVVTVMSALPNVTALVIGHADQRGDPESNFAISEARARAVVSYLIGKGLAAGRLSSRAVGEADLISLNSDEAALALNRRTEFVFYGLLVE